MSANDKYTSNIENCKYTYTAPSKVVCCTAMADHLAWYVFYRQPFHLNITLYNFYLPIYYQLTPIHTCFPFQNGDLLHRKPCHGNATLCSFCVAALYVNANNACSNSVTSNSKTYVGLHTKSLISLSHFN